MPAHRLWIAGGPQGVDPHILPEIPTELPQTLQEGPQPELIPGIIRRGWQKHADPSHAFALLRPHRQRPRRRRAAEQRDEVAPLHSITSSARASSVGGMVRPSTLAVVRLMTSSNLDGCSTGISPGFVPRRILSTNSAVRRN